ncbi:YheC/YheD family protein [Neobacillus niacini]|uniref:YheC/YheD family endospore coat-associated protein n=1 Tax=Neobacillus niacini TaxID=86668 RepID=UPI002040D90A|nr:YheC/YheD family protein [Neobacillus niacini]MCM3690301.1 YheC/YheD family protein [Neobacillus niacini]
MPIITIVPMESVNRTDHFVQMSSKLYSQLQPKTSEIKISVGKKIVKVKIMTVEMSPNEIHFPENLFQLFCLPIQRYKFHSIYKEEIDSLFLGPVVGLVTDFKNNGNEEPYFRSIHSFCEELHHGLTENGGFLYVFSYPEFSVHGYYFEDGKWKSANLPLPDVIYNRIHSRKIEFGKEYHLFRNKLAELRIPIFNDRFLSKWEVHEHLIHENHLQSYIPDTNLFTKDHLAAFVNKFETVFIKPVHGSQGRNIFKLKKENTNLILDSSVKSHSENKQVLSSFEEIYHHIKPLLNNRIYIIQQGIPLLTYQNRGMDFRVLCHKNQRNTWNATSLVARISAEDEFVSNIARGGEIMTPINALKDSMSVSDAKGLITEMKKLAIETATIIERKSSGITGELGIDIGIDQEGNPWLIEVNSKPSKNFEDGQMKIRPSAKAIIQFCTKLALDSTSEMEDS